MAEKNAAMNEVLTLNPDCVVREIGEGLVILVPETSTTHSLEKLGVFIWRQLDGKRDLATVLEAIVSEYEVTEDTARADLLAFVDELRNANLLQAG